MLEIVKWNDFEEVKKDVWWSIFLYLSCSLQINLECRVLMKIKELKDSQYSQYSEKSYSRKLKIDLFKKDCYMSPIFYNLK